MVKYDYPVEHSSAPTYESKHGKRDSDDAHSKRSVRRKLERLQDKIDGKFDKAYDRLVKKEKKTKEPEPVPYETGEESK